MPGASTPPRYSPRAETASKLIAVPKSTTMHGPPYLSKAATLLTMRSAPTSCGLSYCTGMPGLHARLDEQRLLAEIALGHSGERGIQRRHDRADNHAADFARLEIRESEKIARENAVFVDGLIARGGKPPVRDEFLAAENAEHRVCIADIERQKHQDASADVARENRLDAAAVIARHAQHAARFEPGRDPGECFRRRGNLHVLPFEISRDFGETPENRLSPFGEKLIVVAVEVAQQPNQQFEARMDLPAFDAQRRGDVGKFARAFSSGSR